MIFGLVRKNSLMRDLLYTVERDYPVSIEKLWNAWVDPKALEIWYSPVELSVKAGTVANEAVVGGVWTVGVDVPMNNMVALFFGVYTEVKKHELLEHTMTYTESFEEFEKRIPSPVEHLVRIEFKAVDGGSWVSFSQFGELPEGQAPRAKAGMESYFDNLGKFLEQGN
ncbi:MAG: hypothetical protein F2662_03865 [Actinobacteria bacterium]|nr:hypothetical protein [Actinomycetota bacterium]